MRKLLKIFYIKLIFPAIVLYIIFFVFSQFHSQLKSLPASGDFVTLLMIISTVTAFIFPIWFRIGKFNRLKAGNVMSNDEFMKFEKTLIAVPIISVYLLLISYVFSIPKIPRTYLIVLGLYAAYFYYPSIRRLNLEKRIFRISDSD